jgi:cation transport ATPase
MSLEEIKIGWFLDPGDEVPVDGSLVGMASPTSSALTGESISPDYHWPF